MNVTFIYSALHKHNKNYNYKFLIYYNTNIIKETLNKKASCFHNVFREKQTNEFVSYNKVICSFCITCN